MEKITDKLQLEEITFPKAQDIFKGMEYAIVHMISDMEMGNPRKLSVNWDELIELHAFSDGEALHIFQAEAEQKALHIIDQGEEENTLIREYELRNGQTLSVKEYLQPDEDGQAVTVYIRPFAVR